MKQQLKEGVITTITYTSLSKNETKQRTVVPSFVPSDNIKALDVSDLEIVEREQVARLLQEYKKYQQQVLREFADTFENYVEKRDESFDVAKIKWRTFKIDQIQ